ncbi:acetyl-CoA C-acetyltransferase [Gordonia terrae]|uniref:Probable acetyl-CoA acetyltransferase n=2 Tax=Gordonia terrae TaxID=2055 RepID=A0AAD0K9N0_9ACTN|nr:acetyl-CoA C-acetyltransferase [Gordonia terrae]VTR09566.1 acetyl-CoA acetyltransferase [Clostridioides difficile]ANY22180.1 acetyl-CoA acetyltransferase [Gordonia terrae]AWO82922.1 acetyl-CoA C-acetyltransferase [Gordonia terrae]VTS29194.1 Probable acetyl-CoA acetyltransferase [Gordonia terrae]GAB46356.1 putative acetyl-CoA acetyltransferase [Gordonia terrae NBRC 100016]
MAIDPADRSVIVAGARTPVGRFMGSLSSLTAAELGGIAIAAALRRAGISGRHVEQVIMGQVLTAGAGQLPARQAAVAGGVPMSTPSVTVNKVCLSGIHAVAVADRLIRAGDCDIVVAGGQESMSNAPHLLPTSRSGFKLGNAALTDHLAYDGLRDVFTEQAMGTLTDNAADPDVITRADQDHFAATSHQRAAAAWKNGAFDDEVQPVRIATRTGDLSEVTTDEGIRADTTTETLARLTPAFSPDGTVTAGNASPLNDGAAALVIMSKRKATELGLTWLAEIGAYGTVAGPDSTLQLQPANAILAACGKDGITPADLDLIEINEAFASVGIASTRQLNLDPATVNIHGGAISIGHPLAMSGARITLHLAIQLARSGGTGAAALCGGGGQGDALILHSQTQ